MTAAIMLPAAAGPSGLKARVSARCLPFVVITDVIKQKKLLGLNSIDVPNTDRKEMNPFPTVLCSPRPPVRIS